MQANDLLFCVSTSALRSEIAMTIVIPCERCDETGWVCEAHDDRPSDIGASPRACKCGAPGMPRHECNPSGGWDEPSRCPAVFMVTPDGKGPRN